MQLSSVTVSTAIFAVFCGTVFEFVDEELYKAENGSPLISKSSLADLYCIEQYMDGNIKLSRNKDNSFSIISPSKHPNIERATTICPLGQNRFYVYGNGTTVNKTNILSNEEMLVFRNQFMPAKRMSMVETNRTVDKRHFSKSINKASEKQRLLSKLEQLKLSSGKTAPKSITCTVGSSIYEFQF